MDENERQEQEAAQKFIDDLSRLTLTLVRLDPDSRRPIGLASGMLVKRAGRYFVFTAAHALSEGFWAIQTNINSNSALHPKTLLIPLRAEWVTEATISSAGGLREKDVDFGWAELKREQLREVLTTNPGVQLPLYKLGLSARPTADGSYGFAGRNSGGIDPFGVFVQNGAYELYMQFDGTDESRNTGLFRFALGRKHRGHKYYKGCSGAPIVDDATGEVVSLLLCGPEDDDPQQDVIYGLRLADYLDKIPQEQIPSRAPEEAEGQSHGAR